MEITPDDLVARFAHHLKLLRTRRKLSQVALSKLSGIRQAQISLYERGQGGCNFSTVTQIARALNVDPAVLIKPISQKNLPLGS